MVGLVVGVVPEYGRAQQGLRGLALPATARMADRFTPLLPGETALQGGMLGKRITASEKNRLLRVDENDLLDAFERRSTPHQDWQGEHIGKFLHAATLAWSYTRDPALKAKIERVVVRLLHTQESDGYLGTYPPDQRWTRWDVWVHKYALLGLLAYYQFTHNLHSSAAETGQSAAALTACRRIGDLLIHTFGSNPGQRDINRAGEHVGMAADSVLEPIVLLYRATSDPRYLDFARYIVTNYDAPGGPAILTSLETYRSVRRVANAKAYEMLSNFNGLLELYRATGEKRLLQNIRVGWNDIVLHRLYITGSASSFECFQDDGRLPNEEGANICETCVTVTWEQLNLQLLRLTGESCYADEAERAIYNHLFAAQKPSGNMWAYYTPLEGHKPYGNATNCCLSSGPRGIALIPSFAYMTSRDGGLVVNLYNTGSATTRLPAGQVTVTQKTGYPYEGHITLRIAPKKNGQRFPLRLRIPAWTTGAHLTLNGKAFGESLPGTYAVIDRAWRRSDILALDIALPVRLVADDQANAGRVAVLRGPLVLALDSALNPDVAAQFDRVRLPVESGKKITLSPAPDRAVSGEMVFRADGRLAGQPGRIPLYLTPYATAGQDGRSRFMVWIQRSEL